MNCGTELSELLPHTSENCDDICLISIDAYRCEWARSFDSLFSWRHTSVLVGRRWVRASVWTGQRIAESAGPYMVLGDPGGLPVDGVTNWSNGFMPAMFQGTVLRPKEPRILNLDAPPHLKGKFQRRI